MNDIGYSQYNKKCLKFDYFVAFLQMALRTIVKIAATDYLQISNNTP